MTKGGYQIIDLQNKELTLGVGMVYEGIYEKIESTRKAILLSGLNIEEVGEMRDFFPMVRVVGSSYKLIYRDSEETWDSWDGTITIADNDVVTCNSK